MIGGIVEVAEAGRHLSVYRGFLKVSESGSELGRVPLDDITALILSGQQITLSKNLLTELAERKSVVVTCGKNWHPLSFTLPFGVHFESAGILHDQIAASEPLKKRLWQKLVKLKIANQAAVLALHGGDPDKQKELTVLASRVKSGDPENMEAQAARHYWRALLGEDFRRERNGGGENNYLNYGYTVLRAACARAVCAAGLHPSLGVHHRNRMNAFALVDDVIEPFRPLVDSIVKSLVDDGGDGTLDVHEKRAIAAVLQQDLISEKGVSPLVNCVGRLAQSLVRSFTEKNDVLEVFEMKKPGQLV